MRNPLFSMKMFRLKMNVASAVMIKYRREVTSIRLKSLFRICGATSSRVIIKGIITPNTLFRPHKIQYMIHGIKEKDM